MKKSVGKISAATILAMILLVTGATFPDRALTANGVLEKGEDHVHFDLTLTVNITQTAFNITRKDFEDQRETWTKKWTEWKNMWEERREQWREGWEEWIDRWESWPFQWREEWSTRWRTEWNETWRPEWIAKWSDWDEWMQKWEERWKEIRFENMEKIPEFLRAGFRARMMERFRDLWQKHMNASTLAQCWLTPASQRGLKNALGQSLNKTLQRIYNTSDVYIKNFNLTVELHTDTILTDGTYVSTGIFNLAQTFDLYGVIIQNSSGTFIRSQFRRFNVTEKVDGKRFGYPGWVFTPGKAMFMDLSVFSVPLDEWNKTFDPATNTTTFSLVRNINVTTPYGNVIVDPELNLVVPGEASAVGDVIVVAPILPTDLLPLRIIVPTAAVATLAVLAYYLSKRRTMIPRAYPTIL